ncbi:AF4/FMR2 family member lilli-like [Anastrepha obliqua]|uniref:AF4/FMR2 family member lilli-like n=1 Tax=Anastrepha obliqua TaxID=95512 RepID=UPI002408FFC5|nr:AF4/FMR2 family member lilli-like [Anastrepha obliqua]
MKNQLHLNLNVIETLNVDNDDNEGDPVEAAAAAAAVAELKWDGVNVETVTTVPQQQLQPHEQKQQLPEEQQPLRREYSKVEAISMGQTSTIATAAATATVRGEAGTSTAAAATRVAATSLSSSPSLLNSSSTALAKFNRIIDSTMPATNYYQHYLQHQQAHESMQHAMRAGLAPPAPLSDALQQRLALVYPDIVSTDSQTKKINFTTAATTTSAAAAAAATAKTTTTRTVQAAKPKAKVKGKSGASLERLRSARAEIAAEEEAATLMAAAAATATSPDDNQMKRNDVHYLLKQLNSFSDIEEIEIVDMEQRQRQLDEQQQLVQQQQQLAQQQQQQQYMGHGVDKTHSPTAQSLVIISPSSLSHKGIRRYASLHQQQCTQYPLDSDEAIDSVEQQQYLLQQFDDYLFQSCHYLETNYFAANYRTAMVESSSHEFRPSTTTTTGTSAASVSSEHSLELHETEPPSVICKAPPPAPVSPPTTTVATTAMPSSVGGIAVTSTTLKRYGMQARLTTSGVQTELTATSLTEASLAKSTSSSASSEEQRRRAPFFKCCYTPIDRWREKRSAAHTAAAAQKRGSRRATAQTSGVDAAASVSGRAVGISATVGQQQQQQQHTRKNGHAV